MNPEIFDSSEVEAQSRISPAKRIIDALPEEYMTMRQTAEEIGVHIETLRRLCRTDRVKAPTKATRQGLLVIYLFTPEDVEEVRNYFHGRDQKQTVLEAKIHRNQRTDQIR